MPHRSAAARRKRGYIPFEGRSVSAQPVIDYRCHCEPQRGAPQGGLSCPFGAIHLLAISWQAVPNRNMLPGDSHGALPLGMTDLGDFAAVWRGKSRHTISALRRRNAGDGVPYGVHFSSAQQAIDNCCHCEGAKRPWQSPGRQYRIATCYQEIPTGRCPSE